LALSHSGLALRGIGPSSIWISCELAAMLSSILHVQPRIRETSPSRLRLEFAFSAR
jgi:hypothetical protein